MSLCSSQAYDAEDLAAHWGWEWKAQAYDAEDLAAHRGWEWKAP
jgi:hypothetical protein